MKKYILLILFFLFNYIGIVQAQTVNLPMTHWAYDFLDRMETKGLLNYIRNGSRPLTRKTIADCLLQLEKERKKKLNCLSDIEVKALERLKGEFADKLSREDLNIEKKYFERHFYSLSKKPESQFYIDLLSGISSSFTFTRSFNRSEKIYQPYYGAILRGKLPGISFYSDNRIYAEWGNPPYKQHYLASEGYPQNITRDSSRATWDVSKSYFCFNLKKIYFQFGRDNIKWGPSNFFGLMFSGNSPDFDLLKIMININPITFTWFHGSLRSDYSNKWISSHRLEISFTEYLDIGFSEAVIYGNRSVEIAYINPLIPYLIAEHTLGDKDNVCLGIDFDLHYFRNFKIYGELFIDDLFEPWEIFSDFWGNKYAFSLGGQVVDPCGFNDSDFKFQYSRIEPFVYTHHIPVNSYENYNYSLGHYLQPNSDGVFFSFKKSIDFHFCFGFNFTFTRHGQGSRNEFHKKTDSLKKYFLKGIVEKKQIAGMFFIWEMSRDCWLNFNFNNLHIANHLNINNNDTKLKEFILKFNFNW